MTAFSHARIINRDEQEREINTAVIYSGRIKKAPEKLKKGSIQYKVTNVYMKNYDGDEEYNRLHRKIVGGEPSKWGLTPATLKC